MTDSSASKHRRPRTGRSRFAPAAIVAGVVASAAIATTMTGTLGAFTASITNSVNNAATGVLTMQEVGGSSTCNSTDGTGNSVNTNTFTCATINKYGGSTTMVPGTPVTTSITIKNTGTVTASSFTLAPATACSPGNNGSVNGSGNLCTGAQLTLTETVTSAAGVTGAQTTPISGVALASLASTTFAALPAGSTANFTFSVVLPAGSGNTYQGLSASQQLLWTFSAGS